jgi:hypothetical protein
MKLKFTFFVLLFSNIVISQTGVKILFDTRKAESAGNADWVIDADQWNIFWNPGPIISGASNNANAQRFPTPSQTLITVSTPETFWTGGISYWGIDCVKKGYQVESLPYNASLTYGNTSNPQDLSNYKVFVVCEPNIAFTVAEKTAMMQFIQNGGGLFMISDHTISDRNGDGLDSPDIWNDFISNNGVLNNGFGFKFDLANFSQTTSNISALPTDSIIHGTAGNVTQVKWSNGTSMSLTPSQNPTVKGVIFKTGTSPGNTDAMCVYARIGNGKVAALGDSSPPDDGTGDPNDILYNGYIADAAGNHQRLIMNMTIWLAKGGTASSINENKSESIFAIYPNPSTENLTIDLKSKTEKFTVFILDVLGKTVFQKEIEETYVLDVVTLPSGIYTVQLTNQLGVSYNQKFVKQ